MDLDLGLETEVDYDFQCDWIDSNWRGEFRKSIRIQTWAIFRSRQRELNQKTASICIYSIQDCFLDNFYDKFPGNFKNCQKCWNSKLYWSKIRHDWVENNSINVIAWIWNGTNFENWWCDCCFGWTQCSLWKTSYKNYQEIIKLNIVIFYCLWYCDQHPVSEYLMLFGRINVIILEVSNKMTKDGYRNMWRSPFRSCDMISYDFLLHFIGPLRIYLELINEKWCMIVLCCWTWG